MLDADFQNGHKPARVQKAAMSHASFAPRRAAFQPAGSRILTPGVAVTSTSLGHATLLPKRDKLAMSTEAEAMHRAINEHWQAIRSGEQAPIGTRGPRARALCGPWARPVRALLTPPFSARRARPGRRPVQIRCPRRAARS